MPVDLGVHDRILLQVSPARDKYAATIWERNKVDFPPEKMENIRLYGYPDALDFYDPHYTIGMALGDFNLEFVFSEVNKTARQYIGRTHPVGLVWYELGKDGACVNPVSIL